MKNFVKKLYEELQEDVAFYVEMGTPPANRLSGALKSISGIIIKLKEQVTTHGSVRDVE